MESYQELLVDITNLRNKLIAAGIDRVTMLEGLNDLANLEQKLIAAMTMDPDKPHR